MESKNPGLSIKVLLEVFNVVMLSAKEAPGVDSIAQFTLEDHGGVGKKRRRTKKEVSETF